MKTIGSRLKHAREELGLSQPMLAALVTKACKENKIQHRGRLVTCSQRAISQYEQPEDSQHNRTPPIRLIPALAEALGVSIQWLVAGDDDAPPIPQDVLRISQSIVKLPRERQWGLALFLEIPMAPPKDLTWRQVPDVHGESRHERRKRGSR